MKTRGNMKRSTSTTKKRQTQAPVFRRVSIATMKDPRVDATKLAPGAAHREIIVEALLDDRGRRWRSYDGEPPVMLDTPEV